MGKASMGDIWAIPILPALPSCSLGFSLSMSEAFLLVTLGPPRPNKSSYVSYIWIHDKTMVHMGGILHVHLRYSSRV